MAATPVRVNSNMMSFPKELASERREAAEQPEPTMASADAQTAGEALDHGAGALVLIARFHGVGASYEQVRHDSGSYLTASPTTAVYASLPTCKTQGIAIDDYFIMRAIMAPPGLSQGQQAFWIDVFKKVYDSDEWKKFMTDNALQPSFKSGLEFRQFILQYQQLHQDIATKFKWV